MVFENLVCGKLGNFNNFINRKYLLSDVAFTRKGKLSLSDFFGDKSFFKNGNKRYGVLELINKQFQKKSNS